MEIYEPREDSELLRKYVWKFATGKVLDIGTGSGIQAIAASRRKQVDSVLAVDINSLAVKALRKKVSKEKKQLPSFEKITVKKSDLFSGVGGKFDTIIFNPPYLPQDRVAGKLIEDLALYGGKQGWEISERFFNQVNNYLEEGGKILFLFSSLTGREKIEEILVRNLLEFKELEQSHVFFEDLFVYQIVKSKVLKRLGSRGVSGIKYLAHGKRGNVFTGKYGRKKIAVKIKRKESLAIGRVKNEVKWLKKLNPLGIGPRLLFYGKEYLAYEFIGGEFILDWLERHKQKKNERKVKQLIADVLRQCFAMDRLGVNKEEMHRPTKHIIIDGAGKPTMIDFERCYLAKKPHNVTQFGVFLMRIGLVREREMKKLLKEYKREMDEEKLKEILKLVQP